MKKIMNRIFFIILMLAAFSANSQFTDIYNYFSLHKMNPDTNAYEIGVSYNTFVSSNSISNKFVNSILFLGVPAFHMNKYLSYDLKKSNPVKTQNFFGMEDNACMYFSYLPDSMFGYDHLGYRVSVENSNHGDVKFSRDLYNITFFGNKDYAGKTADFTDLQLTYMRYQQVKFGLFKQSKNIEDPFTIYFGIGIIKGQSYNSLSFDTTTLFTEESGEYINLQMQALYFTTDTAKNKSKWYHFNGMGACADIAFTYEDKKGNYFISCSLNDIGFIRWKNNSLMVPFDTTVHWDGVMVDSILWGRDTTFNTNFTKDSLIKTLYAKTKKTGFVKMIPEKINIAITKRLLNNNLYATLGMSYLYHANCPYPLIYAKGDYYFRNKISAGLQLAYGGYGNFQCGLGVSARFTKNILLQLGSSNIIGFILPYQTYAQSAFGRVICNF
ncbi:MAG: hypothetical protein HY958_10720 [Bacteroidia bacterium]|nr:hypothetical protein [Bacteroidia bacterium]